MSHELLNERYNSAKVYVNLNVCVTRANSQGSRAVNVKRSLKAATL